MCTAGVVLVALGPQLGQNGMARRGHRHVGAEHRAVPHIDVGVIHQGQVEVGVDIFAEVDKLAPKLACSGGSM